MRIYHVFGNVIDVNRFNNRISVYGDGGLTVLCFSLDRYLGGADLADCRCVVKTRDAADHADAALPQMEPLEKELRVLWVLTRSTARVPGRLELQLEFHSRAGAEGDNAFWQTRPAIFEIADALDGDAVFSQEPTVFQQWERRIDEVYSQVASSVDRINEIRAEIEKLAGDSGLLEIDAKTLNGRRVDDSATGTDSLWTSQRTAGAIGDSLAGLPPATARENGLMSAADKARLDGLDGLLSQVDAKTLNGKAVDDAKKDEASLWTARRTAEALAEGIAGIPPATAQTNGLMPAADKAKLDGLSDSGLTLECAQDLFAGDAYKFSDGTLLCTRRMQLSAAIDHAQSADQSCWISADIQPGAFPHAFIEEPLVLAQLVNSPLRLLVGAQRSAANWAALQLASPQKQTTAQSGTAFLFAIGRWK